MNIRRCTQIVVPWFSMLAALLAGGWAVYEYTQRTHRQKVHVVLNYVEQFQTTDLVDRDHNLSNVWLARIDEIKTQYSDDYVLRVVAENNLGRDIQALTDFYRRLAICVQSDICDKNVAFDFFGSKVLAFRNMYYPYFRHLKNATNNPDYAERVNEFALDYHSYNESHQ